MSSLGVLVRGVEKRRSFHFESTSVDSQSVLHEFRERLEGHEAVSNTFFKKSLSKHLVLALVNTTCCHGIPEKTLNSSVINLFLEDVKSSWTFLESMAYLVT